MIYHKIHICDLCGHYELCECVSSDYVLEKMIYHKIHICDLSGLHELIEMIDFVIKLENRVPANICTVPLRLFSIGKCRYV